MDILKDKTTVAEVARQQSYGGASPSAGKGAS